MLTNEDLGVVELVVDWAKAQASQPQVVGISVGKYFSIFGGPSFTMFYSDQSKAYSGLNYPIPSSGYHTFELWSKDLKGWIGWNAGISIF